MKRKTKIKDKKIARIDYKDLRHKYRLLSYLMDNIPDVIYFKDKKKKLVLVNKAHAKGLGAKPEDVVGKTDFDFFPKDRAEMMTKDDIYVMRTGKSIIDKVERATRPDGIDNYVSTTKIPMRDEKGKVVGLIGITRDITRRMQFDRLKKEKARIQRKLEALEDTDKLKSEFISAVSHELRTPLGIIKQLVMLIFEETVGSINDKQKEVLGKAGNNIERLKNLIDELLDISRIERNRLKLHYSLVDLNDLLKDSSGFFKKLAQDKGIDLSYSLPKNDISLFIDADRINQVVSNLINNAIKFTEEDGRIKIELKVLETKVRIGVIDTGIGISKKDLPHVFNKFMQISKIAGAERKGVGLGLSIVKELVEKHRGEVWVESKVGVGSKFYFTLPRFYTQNLLTPHIKDRIDALLNKGTSVQFINLLIVNYKEFKERIKVEPREIFKNVRFIIEATFKESCHSNIKNPPLTLIDVRNGKCNIILPGATEKKVAEFIELFKDRIKMYFVKNKAGNVFITLGVLSFPKKDHLPVAKHFPANISIKEIYIGSEMRHFKRISYKADIEILLPGNKIDLLQTVDISEGGVCFMHRKLLKTDSEIKIRLRFFKNKEPIYTRARVAWIKKMEPSAKALNKYKVGLEFIYLKDKYRKIILKELRS